MTASYLRLDQLINRWDVQATLVAETGLHIGSGEESGNIDSGVVLDAGGRPFIPGSSLKGILRSEAERAAHLLGLRACGLIEGATGCLTTNRDEAKEYKENRNVDIDYLNEHLCHACKLFGSPFAASHVLFSDLPLKGEEIPLREHRDGVGIDRDTGTAAQNIKYDFEVIPAYTEFCFHLQAENLDKSSRALLAFVLLELKRGTYSIGGKRSRGLGRCRLADDFQVHERSFETGADILAYLGKKESTPPAETIEFLLSCVKEVLPNA